MPSELDEITRKVMQLEIEEAALKMKTTLKAKQGWKGFKKNYQNFRIKPNSMKSKWQMEKSALQKVQDKREELEKLAS